MVNLTRGRGHKKIEQDGVEGKISAQKGSPIVYLPKALLDLGVFLGQDVIIDYKAGSNPLAWEIKIKPADAPEQVIPA